MMETRDDALTMDATQAKLQDLLAGLRIGTNAATKDDGASSHPPSLPLIDQIRLVSAHIDSIKKDIAKQVAVESGGAELISKQTTNAVHLQDRFDRVSAQIDSIEQQDRTESLGALRSAVARDVAALASARAAATAEEQASRFAELFADAAEAVDDLEALLDSAYVETEDLTTASERAWESCSFVGIVKEASKSAKADTEFAWLTQSSVSTPTALRNLAERLKRIEREIDAIIHTAWSDAVDVTNAGEGFASVTGKAYAIIAYQDASTQLPLDELASTLQSRALLDGLVRSIADDFLVNIARPLLELTDTQEPRTWTASVTDVTLFLQEGPDGAPQQTIVTIMAVLYHMKHYIFDVINLQDAFASLQFEFSRAVVPSLVPLCLAFMKRLLPSKLGKPITERTVVPLNEQATLASELVQALRSLGYLSGGLEAEVEQLVHFAENPGRHFLRALTTSARTRCRDLLLKEKSNGWEGVSIEVEVSILPPIVQDLETSTTRPSVESVQQAGKSSVGQDDWAAWDEEENAPNVASVPSFASPESLARSQSPKVTPTKAQSRQKKSALGGVRVVKPRDQLGSGPMPEDDDDWGWGVDEEGSAPSAGGSTQKSIVAQSAGDEDDWFAQELRVASPPPVAKSLPIVAKTGVKLTRTSTMGSDRSATGSVRTRIITSPQRSGTSSPRPPRSGKVAARTIHSPRNVISPLPSDTPSFNELLGQPLVPDTSSQGHSSTNVLVSPPPRDAMGLYDEKDRRLSNPRKHSTERDAGEMWDVDSEKVFDEGESSVQADESNLFDAEDVPTPLGKAGEIMKSLTTAPMKLVENLLPLDEEDAAQGGSAGKEKHDRDVFEEEHKEQLGINSQSEPDQISAPSDDVDNPALPAEVSVVEEGPAHAEPTAEEKPDDDAWDWDENAEVNDRQRTTMEDLTGARRSADQAISLPQEPDMLRSSSSSAEADVSAAASFTRSRRSIDLSNFSSTDSAPPSSRLVDEGASEVGEPIVQQADVEQTPILQHSERSVAPTFLFDDEQWSAREETTDHNEVLSGSDGMAPSVSVGKSSGSGEKLSDVPTEAWEEMSTSNVQTTERVDEGPLNTPMADLPRRDNHDEQDFFRQTTHISSQHAGQDAEAWGWNDDDDNDEQEEETERVDHQNAEKDKEEQTNYSAVRDSVLAQTQASQPDTPGEVLSGPIAASTSPKDNEEANQKHAAEVKPAKVSDDGEEWNLNENDLESQAQPVLSSDHDLKDIKEDLAVDESVQDVSSEETEAEPRSKRHLDELDVQSTSVQAQDDAAEQENVTGAKHGDAWDWKDDELAASPVLANAAPVPTEQIEKPDSHLGKSVDVLVTDQEQHLGVQHVDIIHENISAIRSSNAGQDGAAWGWNDEDNEDGNEQEELPLASAASPSREVTASIEQTEAIDKDIITMKFPQAPQFAMQQDDVGHEKEFDIDSSEDKHPVDSVIPMQSMEATEDVFEPLDTHVTQTAQEDDSRHENTQDADNQEQPQRDGKSNEDDAWGWNDGVDDGESDELPAVKSNEDHPVPEDLNLFEPMVVTHSRTQDDEYKQDHEHGQLEMMDDEGGDWGWADQRGSHDIGGSEVDSHILVGDIRQEKAFATTRPEEAVEKVTEQEGDLFRSLEAPRPGHEQQNDAPTEVTNEMEAFEQRRDAELTNEQHESGDEELFEPFDAPPIEEEQQHTSKKHDAHDETDFFEQETNEGQEGDVWGWNDEEDVEKERAIVSTTSNIGEREVTKQAKPSVAPPIQAPIKRMEKCLISQRSVDFVRLLDELLDDVEAILEEGQTSQAAGLDIKQLTDCFDDVLDLHSALMPIGHADTLNNVPTLAAQFFNDCTYITRELLRMNARWKVLATTYSDVLKLDRVDLAIEKQAESTALLGQRSFDAQIVAQQQMLEDCLIETNNFEATYDETRFRQCQRAMRQVVVTMQQLSRAWKPVLTTSNHQMACGRLIDVILQRVLHDIIALNDISEVEGEKLSKLVKIFNELEELFSTSEGEPSDVALHVPTWFKATYLSDILTGSLVDIEYLYFEAGALIDYSNEELISLLRALFSDSPKRSRLIEHIQAATN